MLSKTLLFGLTCVSVGTIWRIATRYSNVPFPAKLGWMLDVMDAFFPARMLLDAAQVQTGMRVLDIGAGVGRVAVPAAARVGRTGTVVAVDMQPAMLATIARRAQAAGVVVETRQALAGAQPLGEDSFDRVLMIDMLGEIQHQDAALHEVFRVLKPGGRLFVAEMILDPHYQRGSVVKRLAHAARFTNVSHAWCLGGYYAICHKPREGL